MPILGEARVEAKAIVTGKLHRLKFADETTPQFNELMCCLGKLLVGFSILEQEIKAATAFILDPNTSDLLNPVVSKRERLSNRIDHLKNICRPKLAPDQADRLDRILDQAKAFPDVRHFVAHAYVYHEAVGFSFRKIENKEEFRFTTVDQMKAEVSRFQSWTKEFADLFEELFHGYSSWYLRQISDR